MSTDGATVTPLAQVTRYGDSTFDGDSVYLLGALVGAAAVVHPIRVPLDGSAPVELAGTPTTTAGIAVDGTTVYTCTSALLQRTPKGGGAATTLPTGCESILVDATNIYFSVGRRVFRQAKSSAFAPQLFTDGPACATDVRSARLELVAQNDTKVFFSVGERASESPAACPPHFLGMRAK